MSERVCFVDVPAWSHVNVVIRSRVYASEGACWTRLELGGCEDYQTTCCRLWTLFFHASQAISVWGIGRWRGSLCALCLTFCGHVLLTSFYNASNAVVLGLLYLRKTDPRSWSAIPVGGIWTAAQLRRPVAIFSVSLRRQELYVNNQSMDLVAAACCFFISPHVLLDFFLIQARKMQAKLSTLMILHVQFARRFWTKGNSTVMSASMSKSSRLQHNRF